MVAVMLWQSIKQCSFVAYQSPTKISDRFLSTVYHKIGSRSLSTTRTIRSTGLEGALSFVHSVKSPASCRSEGHFLGLLHLYFFFGFSFSAYFSCYSGRFRSKHLVPHLTFLSFPFTVLHIDSPLLLWFCPWSLSPFLCAHPHSLWAWVVICGVFKRVKLLT